MRDAIMVCVNMGEKKKDNCFYFHDGKENENENETDLWRRNVLLMSRRIVSNQSINQLTYQLRNWWVNDVTDLFFFASLMRNELEGKNVIWETRIRVQVLSIF